MKKSYINWNLDKMRGWKECYEYFLNRANNFSIIYQGDPNDLSDDGYGLNIGKKDFLSLPNVETMKYEGMENSFLVTGILTDEAKALFYKYVSSSFDGGYLELWSFEFLSDNDVLLRTEDNMHCCFNLMDDELKDILDMGIEIDNSYNDPMISFKEVSLKENDVKDGFVIKHISNEEVNLFVESLKDKFQKKE